MRFSNVPRLVWTGPQSPIVEWDQAQSTSACLCALHIGHSLHLLAPCVTSLFRSFSFALTLSLFLFRSHSFALSLSLFRSHSFSLSLSLWLSASCPLSLSIVSHFPLVCDTTTCLWPEIITEQIWMRKDEREEKQEMNDCVCVISVWVCECLSCLSYVFICVCGRGWGWLVYVLKHIHPDAEEFWRQTLLT